MKALLRQGGVLAFNVVAHFAGQHLRLTVAIIAALRDSFAHVRCFVDRDPTVDPLTPTNLLLFASDARPEFDPPPLPKDPEDAPEGTAPHLHATFLQWEPPALAMAAAGLEQQMASGGRRARDVSAAQDGSDLGSRISDLSSSDFAAEQARARAHSPAHRPCIPAILARAGLCA